MIQRSVILLLMMMFVFVGCSGDGEISSVDELSENSPELIVWKKDGKVMEKVTVIEDYTELGNPIYRYYYTDAEYVSVGQYKAFMEASGYRPKEKMNWENIYKEAPTDDDPMTYLSWNEVQAYIKWVGKRLPSSSEEQERGGISTWREDSYSEKEEEVRIQTWEDVGLPSSSVRNNSDHRSGELGIRGVVDVP